MKKYELEAAVKTLMHRKVWFANHVGEVAQAVNSDLGGMPIGYRQTIGDYERDILSNELETKSITHASGIYIYIYSVIGSETKEEVVLYYREEDHDNMLYLSDVDGKLLFSGNLARCTSIYLNAVGGELSKIQVEQYIASKLLGATPTTREPLDEELAGITKPIKIGNVVPSLLNLGKVYVLGACGLTQM